MMTRRLLVGVLAGIGVVAASTALPAALAGAAAPSAAAVDVGSRRELFVDRYLIDTMKDAELRLHRPEDRGKVLAFDKPWEGTFCAYVTILHPAEGKYQAYYRGTGDPTVVKDGGDNEVVCYAESVDGIHWTKPELALYPRHGQAKTNIVLADVPPDAHNFSPMIDVRPGVPADQRYKAIGGYHKTDLNAYTSPDGVHWKKLGDRPVITKRDVGFAEGKGMGIVFDSQNVVFWSELEQKYLCFYRVYKDKKRRIARVESEDFLHWGKPTLMEYRRENGEPAPVEHLYTSQTHPYFRAPHLYVATAARFMPGRKVLTDEQAAAVKIHPRYFNDVSDAVFMTNRNGSDVFDRTFMSAFVAPGIGAENWTSRTNYPALNVVQTGPTEMSVYVNQNYGQPTSHLRRYSMRLDGFASVRAEYDGGEMLTKPLTFKGAKLFLNFATSAYGGIKVEVRDAADGKPFPGFALADCLELIGNEIERPVMWKGGDLRALSGKPVRLRFVMTDADLYALRFGGAVAPGAPGAASADAAVR
jgi:hypothetical protein